MIVLIRFHFWFRGENDKLLIKYKAQNFITNVTVPLKFYNNNINSILDKAFSVFIFTQRLQA